LNSLTALVNQRIELLRPRLLDTTRRNPLINNALSARTASFVRIVDEKPQCILAILQSDIPMRLQSLPPLDDEPPDERTHEFITAFENAQATDEDYIAALEKLDFDTDEAAYEKQETLDRELKDRIRGLLDLPPRPASNQHQDLINHARIHKINPSFTLPAPDAVATDERFMDSALQTLLLPANLQSRMSRIYSKARTYREERGLEVVYLVLGYLEWSLPDADPDRDGFRSPIALVPVSLDRERSEEGEVYTVQQRGSVHFNPVLSHKLQHDVKLDINEIVETFEAEELDIEAAFDLTLAKKPRRMKWSVLRQATFGVFPFQGIDQYYDLDTAGLDFSQFPVLSELMLGREASGSLCGYTEDDAESDDATREVPNLVLDADSSQFLALLKVASGENVALEGPPGSGKSQTIVNAIGNALQAGKRVLFVAQKATALDVVYARLQALQLDRFVLPMVGTKADSDTFYQALEDRIDIRSAAKPRNERSVKRQLSDQRETLSGYIDLLTTTVPGTAITVHQLFGLYAEHNDAVANLPIALKTLPLELPKYAESFDVQDFKAANKDLTDWANDLKDLATDATFPWSSVDSSKVDFTSLGDVTSNGVLELQKFERAMDRLGSEERAALLELLGEYSVGAITVARKTGIHWADEKTLPWQSLIAGGETSHRMLIEFGDLYSRLETACQNNGISVPDALRLSDTAQELARQGELLERLEAINIPTGSLRSAKEAMESELDQLTEVSGRRSLLDRIKIDLAPSDLKKAREHRNKVLEHQWLLATAEGESLTAIRDDLRSGQEALKQAYSLLSDNQTLPSARTVKQTRRVISEAGLLKRIFKPYKVAEALACEWFGYAPKEVTHETLIDDLGELEGAAARWEATRVAEHLETPVSGTAKTVVEGQSDFDAYIQLLSSYGVTGSKIHLLLVTPVLEDVASSLEQLDRVPGDWAAYEGRKSALSETLQWIQANEPVLQAAERTCREENLLKASQITQMSEGCRAAQEHKSRLESLVSELNTGDIATTWASLSALTELMQVALNNADSLNERILLTPYSAEAQSFSAIEEEASIVASLAARLASGKGEIVPAENFSTMLGYLERHLQDLDGFNKLVQRRHIFTTAENYGLGSLLRALEQSDQLEDTSVLAPAALSYFLRTRAEAKYGDQMLEYSGPSLKSARQKLQEADRALISLGPESITAAALGQADPPEGVGHGRKSDYTEMALLRHELQKKRRIPPRKLLKRASGALASLFPCWMMVPSAVAQHLPREELFDLVIIDEASQMTPETSISALMRASQALICGDTNQLPPTNFFRGLSGEEEDDENVTTDEESILELANTQFHPKHRLRWHYRSRHEELISFSNHYVYDNDLVIFPSPGGASDQMGVSLVQINGTFSRGINPAEAQVMADHIVEFMLNNPHRSLGVVVMNQSQMEQLDGLMLRKAEQDPAVAKYIDSWADKDAGLEKFFVKNLENVQGDERDVIFIGTVYGRDSQGRFYQRFGPLNGASGKRRLNVLFSRAKEQIVTFSSIPMDQFNPSDNNEGARLLKLWLQFSHSKRLGCHRHCKNDPLTAT
jgi:hypothetical protein